MEKQIKANKMNDRSCMYDNQMFDNVFFSEKSFRDNDVQPTLELREMAQQCSELSIPVQAESEGAAERREKIKADNKKQKKQMKLDRLKVTEV